MGFSSNFKGGAIHNPHYSEWLKEHGGVAPRRIGDVQCGGLINNHILKTNEMITVRAGIGGINEYIERIRNNIEGNVDNERNRVVF